jgi:hypothetical protein
MVAQQQVRGKARGRCCCITHVDTQLGSPASQVYHSLASQSVAVSPSWTLSTTRQLCVCRHLPGQLTLLYDA